MKYIILSTICILVVAIASWYMAHSRVESEANASMMRVVILGALASDGQERTYTESGLRNIAVQYLRDHHVAIHRDGVGLIVHMKPMDVDSHPVFATIVFSNGGQPNHAVDIGVDGNAIRDYAIEPAKLN